MNWTGGRLSRHSAPTNTAQQRRRQQQNLAKAHQSHERPTTKLPIELPVFGVAIERNQAHLESAVDLQASTMDSKQLSPSQSPRRHSRRGRRLPLNTSSKLSQQHQRRDKIRGQKTSLRLSRQQQQQQHGVLACVEDGTSDETDHYATLETPRFQQAASEYRNSKSSHLQLPDQRLSDTNHSLTANADVGSKVEAALDLDTHQQAALQQPLHQCLLEKQINHKENTQQSSLSICAPDQLSGQHNVFQPTTYPLSPKRKRDLNPSPESLKEGYEEAYAETRKRLLKQDDWVGTHLSNPPNVAFASPTREERIGRRNELASTTRYSSGHTYNDQTLPKLNNSRELVQEPAQIGVKLTIGDQNASAGISSDATPIKNHQLTDGNKITHTSSSDVMLLDADASSLSSYEILMRECEESIASYKERFRKLENESVSPLDISLSSSISRNNTGHGDYSNDIEDGSEEEGWAGFSGSLPDMTPDRPIYMSSSLELSHPRPCRPAFRLLRLHPSQIADSIVPHDERDELDVPTPEILEAYGYMDREASSDDDLASLSNWSTSESDEN